MGGHGGHRLLHSERGEPDEKDSEGDYLEQRLNRYGPYHIFGIREGRYKYIWVEEFEGDREPRAMLFDLTADPEEKRDLAAEMPELTAEFQARVAALRRR